VYINTIGSSFTQNMIYTDSQQNYPSNLPEISKTEDNSQLTSSFSSLSKNIVTLDSNLNSNANASLGLIDVTKLYAGSSAYKLNDVITYSTNLSKETQFSFFETAHKIKIEKSSPVLSTWVDKSITIYEENNNSSEDVEQFINISKKIIDLEANDIDLEKNDKKTLDSFILKVNDIISDSPNKVSLSKNLNDFFNQIQKPEDLSGINSVINSFNVN